MAVKTFCNVYVYEGCATGILYINIDTNWHTYRAIDWPDALRFIKETDGAVAFDCVKIIPCR